MNTTSSLFLFPTDPEHRVAQPQLHDHLLSFQFIDQPVSGIDNAHYTGENFLRMVTFLGCSPTIQFSSDDGSSFCFVRIQALEKPRMIRSQKQLRPPQCPECGKPIKHWQTFDDESSWSCPHCEQSFAAHECNWKHMAGFARTFIEITDIYPKEAIPQPGLLDKLHDLTGCRWDYFYYCE